jgi:hypothetical protein
VVRSNANRRIVSTELGYAGGLNGALRARATGVGTSERFVCVAIASGRWAIESFADRRIVSTELTYPGNLNELLRARSNTIGSWEAFSVVPIASCSCDALRAANGRYVSAELGDSGSLYGILRARATRVGAWEQFTITAVPPLPPPTTSTTTSISTTTSSTSTTTSSTSTTSTTSTTVPLGTSPEQLLLSQGEAFGFLGHSCGGIQEHAYATGFDPASGFPTGAVYMQTRCGGSGRGGGYHVTTYAAWATVTWDFTATVVSDAAVASAPNVDPTFSMFDANGNEVYNTTTAAWLLVAPTFVPIPRVLGISTSVGPASGGTTVTITGTGFTNATAVDFGQVAAASFVITDATSMTAVSPVASAGTVDVTVASAGGTSATTNSDQFTFVAAPTVTALSPNAGPYIGGFEVTITGTNFTGATEVLFGGDAAGFTVNSDTSITAIAPAIDGPDNTTVHVVSIGGTSATSTDAAFTYTI